ncbi:hypothetical protein PHLGIDRAFT_477660 [Phlebiopsis gigantea 11061_1 CR5-6]|uniref:RING-type domain-containing protein n=1 Tax=Phlebiopsis gigantea (strain 11061_1 CR5-6) TaxID=745531 RepID=A0A0C3S9B0_PHLG1|nr:hypothetical protein PHLGIDRAFT_477660 [Phlebiopsis gigantea 11061_1 CR5-6]
MSTTILGTCPICMENLSASIDPVVMPCGHLYCLGCATFIFFQGEEPQACSVCRKKFRGENIIKLFLNSDGSSQRQTVAGSSVGRESEAFAHDQDLVGACEDLLMKLDKDRDDASLAAALYQCVVDMACCHSLTIL